MYTSVKQQMIFKIILDYVLKHSYPPTVREIMALAGLKSSSTAHGYIKRLKEHGLIDWEPDKPRTIKIVQ